VLKKRNTGIGPKNIENASTLVANTAIMGLVPGLPQLVSKLGRLLRRAA
jgi:hypothetical protein